MFVGGIGSNPESADGVNMTIFRPASRLEMLLEGLLGSSGGGGVRVEVSGRGPGFLGSCLGVQISTQNPSEANF